MALGIITLSYFGARVIRKSPYSFLLIGLILLPLILYKVRVEKGHFERFGDDSLLSFENEMFLGFLGISYVSFNLISYLIDVKRKYLEPEKNFFKFLLYALYFPALSSGPLHRYKYLRSQFDRLEIKSENFSKGGRLILWGLFKNLVLANRVLEIIQSSDRIGLKGPSLLFIGFLFFLYIYLNFSSFIDFFRGVSFLLGIDMKRNFGNRIYLAKSRKDFWAGWHITLNNWFRDYYFFSLIPKDKRGKWRNLILWSTFLLIALWHELSVQMIIWGSLNGLWIVLEYRFLKSKMHPFLGLLYHLGISSLLALIFIKKSPEQFLSDLFGTSSNDLFELLVNNKLNLLVIVVCFAFMDQVYRLAKDESIELYISRLRLPIRWSIYSLLVMLILFFARGNSITNYYIQF